MSKIELSEKARGLQVGVYKHFKGRQYEILGVVVHSETLEELVLYRILGDELLWVRPIDMFMGEKELPSGEKVPRFKYVGETK